jgi:hypothetical protein
MIATSASAWRGWRWPIAWREALAGLAVLVALLGAGTGLSAQQPGGVRGRVVDATTKTPVAGVRVEVAGDVGSAGAGRPAALTGDDGAFLIRELPAGVHVLAFQRIGYWSLARPDIAVAPGRTVQLEIEMHPSAFELPALVVSAGYFQRPEDHPVSHVRMNAEEIRRAAGSAGDVSRVLQALPAIAQVADNANDLVVRGGSPIENAFFVDDIQVPNINHFPVTGSTGGPIGMLNVAFIDDVRFSAGGFAARHGDRLSSIVEVRFREGNREQVETQLDANMAGFGGSIEGPLAGGAGSWMLSGHRSFLDFIVEAIGTGMAPRYGDLHLKLTYDPGPRDRLTLLGLGGVSTIGYDQEVANEGGMPYYGDFASRQGTVGATWRRLWRGDGYSVHVVSMSALSSENIGYRTTTGTLQLAEELVEAQLRLRTLHRMQTSPRSRLDFGADAEFGRLDYDRTIAAAHDRLGNPIPAVYEDDRFDGVRVGGYASHTWSPVPAWELTAGLRADYDPSGRIQLSPRAAASYDATERLRLNAATGLYRQRLPALILAQDPAFSGLRPPRSLHAVLGAEYILTESARVTAEAYLKEYDFLPIPAGDPAHLVVDDGTSLSHFGRYRDLVDGGAARSHGLELMIQKKMAVDFYGTASATVFRSRYKGLDGAWRDRTHDNRYVINLVGGYRPAARWEVGARWALAGGGAYTPFDVTQSIEIGTGVVDTARLNGARYPSYHSLNVRFDRHFLLGRSQLTLATQLWNAYDRKNVALYYWNELENRPATYHQWSFFPIIGVEWKH